MTRQLKAMARTDSSLASGPSGGGTVVRPISTAMKPDQAAALEILADVTDLAGRGFGKWLRMEMAARRISQRQLAQRCGVDHSTISRLLLGQRLPTLETAMKLARVLPELRLGPDGSPYARGLSTGVPSPTARIEYALRSDDRLHESQVRELMEHYLALRDGRLRGQRGEGAPRFVTVRTSNGAAATQPTSAPTSP
jgi:transcriptional regulator with XRE-family HTH domain